MTPLQINKAPTSKREAAAAFNAKMMPRGKRSLLRKATAVFNRAKKNANFS